MTGSVPSIQATIRRRFSCRVYKDQPLDSETRQRLEAFMAGLPAGPFGSRPRFGLVAATAEDRDALKGLGTYGFIQGAPAFIVGASWPAPKDKGEEDYGYLLERVVLYATELGLGTCWLGGTFTRSSFAERIQAKEGEQIPAVTPVGYIEDPNRARDTLLRRQIGADQRLPWDQLFFNGRFGLPLAPEEAGAYAMPLEMVRLAPSASNKQPWRVVRDGAAWHFYVQRTRGYHSGLAGRFLKMADLQRVDLGIALCHFELAVREAGLPGAWCLSDPGGAPPDGLTEYTATWLAGGG